MVMASKVSSRSVRRSPVWASHFMASVAWRHPMTPTTVFITPSTAHGMSPPFARLRTEDVAIGGGARSVGKHLTLKAAYGPEHVALAGRCTGVVDEQAGVEIVGAVDHEIIAVYDVAGIAEGEAVGEGLDGHRRVDAGHGIARRECFVTSEVGGTVDNLTLQIAQTHSVGVEHGYMAHSCGGQIEGYGRAEAAGSDYQHPSLRYALLSGRSISQSERWPR